MAPEGRPRGSSLPAALVVLLVLAIAGVVLILLNSRGGEPTAERPASDDPAATAGAFSMLYAFDGYSGSEPVGVALDPDGGGLFASPTYGGPTAGGTVVRFDFETQLASVVHAFDVIHGDAPAQVPVLSEDGETMYGAASRGGRHNSGVLWRMNADGSDYEVLVDLEPTTGSDPQGPPVLSSDGSTLYGATSQSGPGGYGTLYRVGTSGERFSVLHAFTGDRNDGGSSLGALTVAGDGTVFGMTFDGGSKGDGTIFRVDADGSDFRVLHDFTGGRNDGSAPMQGHLVLAQGGRSLFGMTRSGGADDDGTIFRIGADGRGFDVLHSFSGEDGAHPYGSVTLDPDGKFLYGLTVLGGAGEAGALFRVGTDGEDYDVLHSFELVAEGAGPEGAVVVTDDGSTLYGVTSIGSVANGGSIFSYDLDA